jgi:pilus assembly protein CpaC
MQQDNTASIPQEAALEGTTMRNPNATRRSTSHCGACAFLTAAALASASMSFTLSAMAGQATTPPTTRPLAGNVEQEQVWAEQWAQFKSRLSGGSLQGEPVEDLRHTADITLDGIENAPATAQLGQPFDWLGWNDLLDGQAALVDAPGGTAAAGTTELVAASELTNGRIHLLVNGTRIIRTLRPYYRVSVASPDIADVTPLSPDTLMLSTKAAGNTQLVLWDENDRSQTLQVQSEADLRELQEKLANLLPNERVEAVDLRGQIALRGRVSSTDAAARAIDVASAYSEEVIDFMEIAGSQQVMLEIRFAEVSRSAGRQLGFNFGLVGQDGSAASNIGAINPLGPGVTGTGNIDPTSLTVSENASPAVTLFGGGVVGDVAFEAFLAALRENNLLRVLAEPNLTRISGEEGEFLAGGRIPIPVPQGDETLTIKYEDFGIRLKALPVVLGDGRIRVRVEPEVSDIDRSTGVSVAGVSVPGFRVRRLSTEVELVDGQTFVLAGLLDSSVTASKQVTPLLGDVPVLGALFRSTRYQRRETELVVLITPRLVSPLNPDEIPPLPGENWRHPSEYELFLLGQLGGEAGVDKPHAADVGGADDAATRRGTTPEPRLEGSYTFLPPEPAAGN